MGQKIKKLKKIRIHREGTDQLVFGGIALVVVAAVLWMAFDNKIPFWAFLVVFGVVYGIVLNFYRCPIRFLNVEDTEKLVVAPADGKIVVMTTQVTQEGSNMSVYEVGQKIKNAFGLIESYDMTLEATVTKLMWILGQTKEPEQVKEMFYQTVGHDILWKAVTK